VSLYIASSGLDGLKREQVWLFIGSLLLSLNSNFFRDVGTLAFYSMMVSACSHGFH
jgi:hypothetical protein